MNFKIKIALAGHKPLLNFSMKQMLCEDARFECVDVEADQNELTFLIKDELPHIVLMDMSNGEDGGIEFVKMINTRHPKINIVLFCSHQIDPAIHDFLSIGVKGFIYNHYEPHAIKNALAQVIEKGFYLNENSLKYLIDNFRANSMSKDQIKISVKEFYVLNGLRKGQTEKEIADKLQISKSTVHFHKKNIFLKTNTHSLGQLLNYLYAHGNKIKKPD